LGSATGGVIFADGARGALPPIRASALSTIICRAHAATSVAAKPSKAAARSSVSVSSGLNCKTSFRDLWESDIKEIPRKYLGVTGISL